MSLVEDYSHVAVIEILSMLKRMRRHCGPEFQVTTKTINKTLKRRFGITYQGAGRKLIKHVIDVLLERGVLEVWDRWTRTSVNLTVYQVNTAALNNT